MPVYPWRAVLPSQGRSWRRSSSTVLSQVCLGLPVLRRQSLGGPRMQARRARGWSWPMSARHRWPKKDKRRWRIVSDRSSCPVRDRTTSLETKSVQWIWRMRLRNCPVLYQRQLPCCYTPVTSAVRITTLLWSCDVWPPWTFRYDTR